MSVANILIVISVAVVIALFIALVTVPSWFAQSLQHSRIWRLRDEMADSLLAGELSRKHPAVKQLFGEIEVAAREKIKVNLPVFYLVTRWDKAVTGFLTANEDTAGLSRNEVKLLEDYRRKYEVLSVGNVLVSSWLGILQIGRYAFSSSHHSFAAVTDYAAARLIDEKHIVAAAPRFMRQLDTFETIS